MPVRLDFAMATLLICPVCDTRYETQAVFPPEGRKVRCSKCGHVWQAKPVTAESAAAARPAPQVSQAAVQPQRQARQAPPPPQPMPQPQARPRPSAAPANAVPRNFPAAPPPQVPPNLNERVAGPPADAEFDAGGDGGAQVGQMNAEDVAAAFPGGLPGTLAGDREERRKSRKASAVTLGWLVLALVVAGVLGAFVFAPKAVTSVLPGATRIYDMLGIQVGTNGLALQGVRYGWSTDGGQTVLEVQGNVVNTGSATVTVPDVVIALRDEKGDEISEWTTEVGESELAAGQQAPFLRQIPSPPSNVRSLKVGFAKAD
jgi:predicted Zn finger-like uncharacterized protein